MNNDDILKISSSAKLEFNQEYLKRFLKEFEIIMNWIKEIQTIDTENVEPMISSIIKEKEESDVNVINNFKTLEWKNLELNAPDSNNKTFDESGNFFRVPKVL